MADIKATTVGDLRTACFQVRLLEWTRDDHLRLLTSAAGLLVRAAFQTLPSKAHMARPDLVKAAAFIIVYIEGLD